MRSLVILATMGTLACSGTPIEPSDPGPPQVDPTNPTVTEPFERPTFTAEVNTNVPTLAHACPYPASVEPMELEEGIAPYAWAEANHRDGRTGSLDLHAVHCDDDDDVDWSPFDVLLFVSIPAW